MGKTRYLCKKIKNTKGKFHAKMGTIKDRNSMDLTEAEDIKKRWQEYTELYKKDLSLFSVPKKGNGISSQSQRRAVPRNVQTTAQFHLFHLLAK